MGGNISPLARNEILIVTSTNDLSHMDRKRIEVLKCNETPSMDLPVHLYRESVKFTKNSEDLYTISFIFDANWLV